MHQNSKKYLLRKSVSTLISDLNLPKEALVEFFTLIKVCKEIKFSKIDSHYTKTVKSGIVGFEALQSTDITKEHFHKEKKHRFGKMLVRDRYRLQHADQTFYLSSYAHELESLYLLEIYFKKKSDSLHFQLPSQFQEKVIKDITHDERYKSKNLALLGDPEKNPYTIYSIFKDIELGRITELNETLFPQMKTSDAVRIVLFKLFIDLKLSHDLIIETNAQEGVRAFQSALQKSRRILKSHEELFDKKIVRHVKEHLRLIKSALKNENDLRFIQEEIAKIEPLGTSETAMEINKRIEENRKVAQHKIRHFLSTRKFAIIFKQYELMLREHHKAYYSIDAQNAIQNSILDKLAVQYKNVVLLCDKYEGCDDDKSLKKMQKSFKILKTLLQEFHMTLDPTDAKIMLKSVNQVVEKLKNIRDLDKKALIAQTYIENLHVRTEEKERLQNITKQESRFAAADNNNALHEAVKNFKHQKPRFKQ